MMKSEKLLAYKLKIRVYGRGFDPSVSHSYLVDDVPCGTSSPIGELTVDLTTVTARSLRPIIQFDSPRNMSKRSLMFQEAMFIMSRLPNYYDRPREQLNKFRFGLYKVDGSDFKLLSEEDEDRPIAELFGVTSLLGYDLAIVPLSQIPPES